MLDTKVTDRQTDKQTED